MDRNRVTVRDVAEKAGVSPSTVSRVISDNPRISRKTRDRVLKIMDELNFHPNAIARSLAMSTTKVIGIIIPYRSTDTLLNPFFPEALRGIIASTRFEGYDVLISSSANFEEELNNIKSLFNSNKVDGVILMSSRNNDDNIAFLTSVGFPFTVIGTVDDDSTSFVDNDNKKACYELTQLLTKSGRSNIIFASGELSLKVTESRSSGYKKALEEEGLSYDEKNFLVGSFDEETGAAFARKIIESEQKVDGIIATDDVIAYGLIKGLQEAGIKVPQDIAVASFNNSLLSKYSGITSVDINAYELGKESARMLCKILHTENDKRQRLRKYIDYTIVERDTTRIK